MNNAFAKAVSLARFAAFFAAAVLAYLVATRPELGWAPKGLVLAGLAAAGVLVAIRIGVRSVEEAGRGKPKGLRLTFLADDARRISLLAVAAAAIAAGLFSSARRQGAMAEFAPVRAPLASDDRRHVLRIDGDADGDHVEFNHESHRDLMSSDIGCVRCHHMNRPGDFSTPCRFCHADMKESTCIFDHQFHINHFGGKDACQNCHDLTKPKGRDSAKKCTDCHQDQASLGTPPLKKGEPKNRFDFMAPCYPEAMRGTCLKCHLRMGRMSGTPEIYACDFCHKAKKHMPEEIETGRSGSGKHP
jgi:hypothetical protein